MQIGIALIVLASIAALIWIAVELKRFRHKIGAIFLIGLLIFMYASIAMVFHGKNVDYKTVSGVKDAAGIYFSWLGGVFGNLKQITTNAIKMDWSSKDKSKEDDKK